jgi:hypothetical protein
MTRILHILFLAALVAASTTACQNSDNALRNPNGDPNSLQDNPQRLPTNAE